jgi:hypothetical protein
MIHICHGDNTEEKHQPHCVLRDPEPGIVRVFEVFTWAYFEVDADGIDQWVDDDGS